jgi:DNA-binding MarR family transcriptional regulator
MEEDIYSAYSFLLDKTTQRVKQYAKKKFQELNFGITVDQWIVLKNVYAHEGISQSELAAKAFKGMPTLTHIIDLLCKKGLLKRETDEGDRRRSSLTLTTQGREKVEELWPKVSQIRRKAWQNLSREDFEHFKHILDVIYNNLAI